MVNREKELLRGSLPVLWLTTSNFIPCSLCLGGPLLLPQGRAWPEEREIIVPNNQCQQLKLVSRESGWFVPCSQVCQWAELGGQPHLPVLCVCTCANMPILILILPYWNWYRTQALILTLPPTSIASWKRAFIRKWLLSSLLPPRLDHSFCQGLRTGFFHWFPTGDITVR